MTTATDNRKPSPPLTPADLAVAVEDELARIPDLVERYRAARDAEPLMKAALAQAARAAVNEMWDAGKRGSEIAAALGVSRQRVEQMVSSDRLAAARLDRLNEREMDLLAGVKKVRSAKRKATKKVTAKMFTDAPPVTPAELQRTAPGYASGVLDVLVGEAESSA